MADARGSRWLLAVLVLGAFMTVLDTFIVNIAIPTIRGDLHASFAAVELVIAGYVLTYAVLLVVGGRLGDRWTPRTAFLAGVGVFTAASLACGLAPDIRTLIAARVLQGAGSALVYPQVFALIQVSFAGAARTRALGILSGTNGLAAIVGQIVGGFLIRLDPLSTSWRSLFLVNVPIGAAGMIGAARVLPRDVPQERGTPLDLGGVVLLAVSLLLLTGPLVEGRDTGWPPWLLAALVAALPAFALFFAHERRVQTAGRIPLVDVDLLRTRSFAVGVCTGLLLFAQAAGLYFILALTLQGGLGYSAFDASLVFVPLGLTYGVSTIAVSRIVDRLGPRVLTAGYCVGTLAMAAAGAIAYAQRGHVELWVLVPLLAVTTAANGCGTAPLFGMILADVPREHAGLAGGSIATATRIGSVLGVVAIGFVFDAGLHGATPAAGYVRAFAFGTLANAALLLLATVLSLQLRRPDAHGAKPAALGQRRPRVALPPDDDPDGFGRLGADRA